MNSTREAKVNWKQIVDEASEAIAVIQSVGEARLEYFSGRTRVMLRWLAKRGLLRINTDGPWDIVSFTDEGKRWLESGGGSAA